jgi:multidrug efflux pump subunit AcrA (membrane-fusion protein)
MIELEPVDADLAVEQAKRRLDADLAKIGLKAMPDRGFDIDKVPTVVQARVSLDRARLNLGRERALVGKGSGTVQDYQNAENDEQAALAAYDAARLTAESSLASALASKVALDVAEQARRDLVTITPEPSKILPGLTKDVSFAVTRRAVSEGQMVREGDALFDLVIENPLRLRCDVPEVYASEIRLGQEVRITVLSHPGRIFGGKVSRINPSVDPVSRTFQVEAAVPNDDGALRPGGFAKVGIVTAASSEAITVPRAALVEFAGVTKLYLIDSNQRARSIPVERGIDADRWVEVIGDVPRTGNVAIDGALSLAEGTLVTVIEPLD